MRWHLNACLLRVVKPARDRVSETAMTGRGSRSRSEDLDAAYISALFGLSGATVGASASFLTTWMTQHVQYRDRMREGQRLQRIDLFKAFITEASRLYGDALSHERDDVGDLVLLYAVQAELELVASHEAVQAGRRVIDTIIEAYLTPNRSLREIHTLAAAGKLDFLAEFAAICRRDLAK